MAILDLADVETIRGLTGTLLTGETDEQVVATYRTRPVERAVLARYPDAATVTGDDLADVKLAVSYLVAASILRTNPERVTQSRIGDETLTYAGVGDVADAWTTTAWDILDGIWPEDAPTGVSGGALFTTARGWR